MGDPAIATSLGTDSFLCGGPQTFFCSSYAYGQDALHVMLLIYILPNNFLKLKLLQKTF